MKHSASQYAQALLAATEGASQSETEAILARLRMRLIRTRSLQLLRRILERYTRLLHARDGVVDVRVRTARPIDAATLSSTLGRHLGAPVSLTLDQDERLIGGAVITVDDTRIDASVRRKLEQLRSQLRHSIR